MTPSIFLSAIKLFPDRSKNWQLDFHILGLEHLKEFWCRGSSPISTTSPRYVSEDLHGDRGEGYKFRDMSLNPGGLVLVHISSPNSCSQVTSLGIGNPELSRLKKGDSFGAIDFHLVMVLEWKFQIWQETVVKIAILQSWNGGWKRVVRASFLHRPTDVPSWMEWRFLGWRSLSVYALRKPTANFAWNEMQFWIWKKQENWATC